MKTPDPSPAGWPAQLARGLDGMSVALNAAQQSALLAYLALLMKWNRAYNLSAVRDPAEMVRRHLLDSLSILPWVDAGPVLDVGSGAGLPGIPLAIARPDLAFTLLDSNGKKTRFIRQAVAELRLPNVEVIQSRVELLQPAVAFRRITARAYASLADLVTGSRRLLAADGCWLAMKAGVPHAEIRALPRDLQVEIHALGVPGEAGARHLVVIRGTLTDRTTPN